MSIHFLKQGKIPPPLLRAEVRDIILEHITALYAFFMEKRRAYG